MYRTNTIKFPLLFSWLYCAGLFLGLFTVNMVHAEAVNLTGNLFLQPSLQPRDLAVIANQADSNSMAIARYYIRRRAIPESNLLLVNFAPGETVMPVALFKRLKAQLDSQVPAHIQAFALTWAAPYRVGCMSITTAFATGFDSAFCADGCKPTRNNPYFNAASTKPYSDYNLRPTMAIAGISVAEAKRLIDRGIAADNTYPLGTAYLLSTDDNARNTRAASYQKTVQALGQRFNIKQVQSNVLREKKDIVFYFTGLAQVTAIRSNRFLPGAIADHLTSTGGQLTNSQQMSSLRWLEAGATGSYGAVVEPCNFPRKFPHPAVVMYHYLHGDTLIEAYWKSVYWPGQGIFVGEPLAKPFGVF